jgi:hypothetical protein
VLLSYAVRDQPMNQAVHLDWTAPNYGGHRGWFLCPLCFRRCAVLLAGAGPFACRQCCGAEYQVTYESCPERLMRRVDRVRVKLGPGGYPDAPERPGGAWRKRWDRDLAAWEEARFDLEAALYARSGR